MKPLVVLVLAALIAIMPVAVCQAETASADSAKAAEPASVWDDWYGHLEARSGFTTDFKGDKLTPYVTTPVLSYKAWTAELGVTIDVDESTEAKGPDKLLFGATYSLGNLEKWGVDVPWAKLFTLSIGPFGSYEFGTGDFDGGLMVTLVQASFDEGNVSRQEKR